MKYSEQSLFAGIDIGISKTVIVVGRLNATGKIEILGHGEVKSGIARHSGLIAQNETMIANNISAAIAKCTFLPMGIVPISKALVCVSLPNARQTVVNAKLKRKNTDSVFTDTELYQLINQNCSVHIPANDAILDVLPGKYHIDRKIHNSTNGNIQTDIIEGQFNIISIDKEVYATLKKSLQNTSINARKIVMPSVAARASLVTDTELVNGVAIIDIGAGSTEIAIYNKGELVYIDVIPIGGNYITIAIANHFNISPSQAEFIKIAHGNINAKQLFPNNTIDIDSTIDLSSKKISVQEINEVIYHNVSNLLTSISQKLTTRNGLNKSTSNIVVTGGTASLPGIVQLMEDLCKMNVRIGYCGHNLTEKGYEEFMHPKYAAAIGLLMLGCTEKKSCNIHTHLAKDRKLANTLKDSTYSAVQAVMNFISRCNIVAGNICSKTIKYYKLLNTFLYNNYISSSQETTAHKKHDAAYNIQTFKTWFIKQFEDNEEDILFSDK